MVSTQIAPVTFQYSHTIGRQESRGGDGFFNPVSIARGEGDLVYVLNRGTETPIFTPCKRVTMFTIDEEYIDQFGKKVGPEDATRESTPDGSFMWPTAIALDSESNVYVADEWLNRISIFTKDGEWVGKWGEPGDGDGEMSWPAGLAFDSQDRLYVVDSHNNRVQVFTKDGKFLFKWGTAGDGDGEFNIPWGIHIDHNDDVYVADWRNDRIQKFSPDGSFLMKFGSSGDGECQFNRPTGVAVDKDGIIYVADYKNDRVQVFDADGGYITKLTGSATLSKWGRERVDLNPQTQIERDAAQNLEEREKVFQGPIEVEVDDDGRLFVTEVCRHRVQVFQKQTAIYQGGTL